MTITREEAKERQLTQHYGPQMKEKSASKVSSQLVSYNSVDIRKLSPWNL